jgi:hypothetical protein
MEFNIRHIHVTAMNIAQITSFVNILCRWLQPTDMMR